MVGQLTAQPVALVSLCIMFVMLEPTIEGHAAQGDTDMKDEVCSVHKLPCSKRAPCSGIAVHDVLHCRTLWLGAGRCVACTNGLGTG